MVNVSYGRDSFYTVVEAYGEGALTEGDMEYVKDSLRRERDDISFVLGEGITKVEKGVLVHVKSLRELVIADSVKAIEASEKLSAILKKNRVIIRGGFDGYAMQFAKENRCVFMHRDVKIGEHEGSHEDCEITLQFDRQGNPRIRENYISSGTSGSNYGGGEIVHYLSSDFYMNMTVDDVADVCSKEIRETVAKSAALAEFMNAAKQKGFIRQ